MPAELAERYDQNSALKGKEIRITTERQKIMSDYEKASRAEKDTADIDERIDAFNEANPDYPITPKSLRQSIRSRERMRDNKVGGINLNPKLADRLREEATPLIYGDNEPELENAD